jgi:hypothetical protein
LSRPWQDPLYDPLPAPSLPLRAAANRVAAGGAGDGGTAAAAAGIADRPATGTLQIINVGVLGHPEISEIVADRIRADQQVANKALICNFPRTSFTAFQRCKCFIITPCERLSLSDKHRTQSSVTAFNSQNGGCLIVSQQLRTSELSVKTVSTVRALHFNLAL